MDKAEGTQDDSGKDRKADDRLIHALLLHLYDDQGTGQREERLQRAFKAIRESDQREASPSPSVEDPVARRRRVPTQGNRSIFILKLAIAAAVLLPVCVVGLLLGREYGGTRESDPIDILADIRGDDNWSPILDDVIKSSKGTSGSWR